MELAADSRFIEKALLVHGSTYDYSKVTESINIKTALIICKTHGVFQQRRDVHLRGGGCKKCVYAKQEGPAFTTEKFVSDLISRYGNTHDYSLTVFTGSLAPITVICPTHGEFEQQANSYKRFGKCPQCSYDKLRLTQEKFLTLATEVHNGYYDYSQVDLTLGGKQRVTIICPVHGEFAQPAGEHSRGVGCKLCKCASSARTRAVKTDEFIRRAAQIHGNKYDYSKTVVDALVDRVVITCPVHGDFEQIAQSHVSKSKPRGCILCRNDNTSYDMVKKYKNDPALGKSLGKIYVLEMFNEKESFLKVGITSDEKGRFKRYRSQRDLYNFRLVHERVLPNLDTAVLEREIFKTLKDFKVKPLLNFTGRSECLELSCLEEVVSLIERGLEFKHGDNWT